MQTEELKTLYTNINNLLKEKYEDEDERDEIIKNMSELIYSEVLLEIIESVTDEEKRKQMVDAVNNGDEVAFQTVVEELNIDLEEIITRKSREVYEEAVN